MKAPSTRRNLNDGLGIEYWCFFSDLLSITLLWIVIPRLTPVIHSPGLRPVSSLPKQVLDSVNELPGVRRGIAIHEM